MPEDHRCRVKLVGRSCDHDLCVQISRAVPPELRCAPAQPSGYGGAGSGVPCGCRVPDHLGEIVERTLRDNLQEARRQGFVMVSAA